MICLAPNNSTGIGLHNLDEIADFFRASIDQSGESRGAVCLWIENVKRPPASQNNRLLTRSSKWRSRINHVNIVLDIAAIVSMVPIRVLASLSSTVSRL